MRVSSEPEGIRKDAKCLKCGIRFMVTKAHLTEIGKSAAPAKQELDSDLLHKIAYEYIDDEEVAEALASDILMKFQPPKMKVPSIKELSELWVKDSNGGGHRLGMNNAKAIRALIEKGQP